MQEFWDSHQDVIKDGMSEQGRLQRWIRKIRDVLYKSIDADQVDKFLTAKSLTEQNALFEQLPLDKLKEIQM